MENQAAAHKPNQIKVLGICGSPIQGGNTEIFLKEALKASEKTGDTTTELISLADKDIKDCNQDNWCIMHQEEGNFCSKEDDLRYLLPKILEADCLLLATPSYTGKPSAPLSALLDRLRCLSLGKYYRGKEKSKVAGVLAIGWGRSRGIETCQIPMVYSLMGHGYLIVCPDHGTLSGSHWGACGVSSENGTGIFDSKDKLGILKDEFGLIGARSLGRRVANVAKIVRSGEAQLPELAETIKREWSSHKYRIRR